MAEPIEDGGGEDELRARLSEAERQMDAAMRAAESRVVRAELKAEAIRAGMVDLDGLKLLDLSAVKLDDAGEVPNAGQMMSQLKRTKPWLFGGASSSSAARAPAPEPPRTKLATEMSIDEWRTARAELLKRR